MSEFADTLFVFTTTPAGLGHIRVMNAIKDGKPYGIDSVDIGIINIKANRIHDLGSRVQAFVKLTEFYQTNPTAEWLVTKFYTQYLRKHTEEIVKEFEIIKTKYPNKKEWVIISTHFALAHSISAVKEELQNKLQIKIYLCVVVTDDSPQRVWAVSGSDITYVASNETRNKLIEYFPKEKQGSVKTISFPIPPRLTQDLSVTELQFVINQLNPKSNISTQIEVPISGAAVQLDFFQKLIQDLCQSGYSFSVIGQESILTTMFFENIIKLPRVQVSIGANAWQAVKYYESLFYQPSRPAIEITKPSEQAFKAILTPRQRGGVILLLTTPIGRQEYDNLKFLERNGLTGSDEEHKRMYEDNDLTKWIPLAKNWRAIKIPSDPIKAAKFIRLLKNSGVFYSMLSATISDKPNLKPDGVNQIWAEIKSMISNPQVS